MVGKHIKRWSTSLFIKKKNHNHNEVPLCTHEVRYNHKNKNTVHCCGQCKMAPLSWKQFGDFTKS